jgi:hypothetical protein
MLSCATEVPPSSARAAGTAIPAEVTAAPTRLP